MAAYEIRPLHSRLLQILDLIDKTFQEQGLQYYIWAGTMLGAIRHKGFIPWDDDVDIAMPRPDYERLIRNSSKWLPEPLEFVCAENDAGYPLPFGKIQDGATTVIERKHFYYLGGIYIDVFPIDGTPDSMLRRRAHFAYYEYLKRLLYLLHRDPYKHGHGPSSWIPLICRKMFSMATVQQRIRHLLLQYDYNRANLVADYDDGFRGAMPKSILGNPARYGFEGIKVSGVELYDEYLRNKYGDYMTIPDIKHQKQHNYYHLNLRSSYHDYNHKNT